MGGGLVVPRIAGAQKGLKGGGLQGRVSRCAVGPAGVCGEGIPEVIDLAWGCGTACLVVGIPMWCGSSWGLGSGMAEGQLSQWCVDPAWPKRWGSRHAWFHCRAVVWRSLRVREPGRMEQQLCRPMGWGFGSPAVLLLDHGMEKPSTI
jgi:hypothetical protein